MRPLRIVIACAAICFGKGGMERAAINLAAAMRQRGHEVLLLSCFYPGKKAVPVYPAPADVMHLSVDVGGAQDHIQQLRDFLKADKTDVLVSMQCEGVHLLWEMACMGAGIPYIYSERHAPERIEKLWSKAGRRAAHAGADFIHLLLPDYLDSVYPDFRDRCVFIPNCRVAPKKEIKLEARKDSDRKNILYLARFNDAKRPQLLLDAFEILAGRYPEWDLILWGHGELEGDIKKHISRMRYGDRVYLKGQCDNVEQAYAEGDIYCLPSLYEGFPNTVLEAMAAGLPIVGVADCAAMRSILGNGEGLLAPEATPQALAETLAKLMADEAERQKFSRISLRTLEKYQPEKVYDQWEDLLYKAAARKGHTVMDSFYDEPFASKARLSSAARREWLFRDFGDLMPFSFAWWKERLGNFFSNMKKVLWPVLKNFAKRD